MTTDQKEEKKRVRECAALTSLSFFPHTRTQHLRGDPQ